MVSLEFLRFFDRFPLISLVILVFLVWISVVFMFLLLYGFTCEGLTCQGVIGLVGKECCVCTRYTVP